MPGMNIQAFVPATDRAPVAAIAEQAQGLKFAGVGVECQFQQRQRELEQPQQQ
jgi:hypothetical protein